MGRGLLLWGGGSPAAARERARAGATVLAWPGCDPAPLVSAGVRVTGVEEALPAEARDAVPAARARFARVWARLPLAQGRSFRDLAAWRGESLLWAVEGFLREATAGPRCAGTIELCLRLFEALQPDELDASGLPPAETALVARSATAAGVLFHGEPARPPHALPVVPRLRPAAGVGIVARLFGRPPALPPGEHAGGRALVLVSDPSDRPRLEPLFEALRQRAGLALAVVTLAELARFETRAVRRTSDEVARGLAQLRDSLCGTPAVLSTYAHRGVGFADLAAQDLPVLLCGQLPGRVRQMECALAAFAAARAGAVVLGVEDPDERRALGTAARVAGLPWLVAGAEASARRTEAPARADAGPQPAATVEAPDADPAAAIDLLVAAMRGSVGAS